MTGWAEHGFPVPGSWSEDPFLVLTLALGAGLLAGFSIGWLLCKLRSVRRIATLEAMLEYEIQSADERMAALQQTFGAASAQALRDNSEQFLTLAKQSLGSFQQQADSSLQQRQQAVHNMVQPLAQALQKTEQQLKEFDRNRQNAHVSLSTHMEGLADQHLRLEKETRSLVQALRRPEVRGRWGEISLRRLVELAGMVEHCDFLEQVASDDRQARPDMVIQLPADRRVVIDAKTPMDAYLEAVASEDAEPRERHLERHAAQVRKRVAELAAKAYWSQFDQSPDFVVLYIPGDAFLSAALERQPDLLESALARRVMLATPTSLVALLRTVAYGWSQQKLNDHALEIRESAEEFHQRLALFSEHLGGLGQTLDRLVAQYNRSVGSFDGSLMPVARRFADLGLRKNREAVSPSRIEQQPRAPKS